MGQKIIFSYFNGNEADQFIFLRIPKILITDSLFSTLSTDAKLLYGLMLDRMACSIKYGWIDDKNHAYIIYTVEQVSCDLGCGKDKAVKVLAELDTTKGIGLIERIRRGLGKPDIIYVKNFASYNNVYSHSTAEVLNSEFKSSDSRLISISEKQTSANMGILTQDIEISETNNTNTSDTKTTKTNSIYPSPKKCTTLDSDDVIEDKVESDSNFVTLTKKNLDYDNTIKSLSKEDRVLFEELFTLICNIGCSSKKYIVVNSEPCPHGKVKEQFSKLTSKHLKYVMEVFSHNTKPITNIRNYLITALYNAPSTIDHYYQHINNHNKVSDAIKARSKASTQYMQRTYSQEQIDALEKKKLGIE